MGKPEIERFLSHLAVNRNVASSTQNQALNAILFLYKHVLDMPLNGYIDATRSKKRKRLPTVLNQSEISRFFGILHKTPKVVYTFRVLAKILIFFMTCRTPENKALQGAQKNCWEFGLSRKV
jgi:site-specific recombinase XerD